MRGSALVWLLAVLAGLFACGGQAAPRPYGEALIFVDTDLPLSLAGRLRIDLYSDGTWFDSREVTRTTAQDWPASFSVYSDDDTREKLVWARLRVSAAGLERDYRGERYRARGAEAPSIDPPGRPRLVRDGADITPSAEPDPWVTVDRLLFVRLRPGVRGAVRVVLHGICGGTMSKLAARTDQDVPIFGEASTCLDGDGQLVRVEETPLSLDRTTLPPTQLGTFGRDDCVPEEGPAAPNVDAVCIPGGVFLLGSWDFVLDYGVPTWPARLVQVPRFFLDRREITVARYRAGLAAGFTSSTPDPIANDAPLTTATDYRDPGYCTFSKAPRDREGHAITCIPWDTARRFCAYEGGDLPTEAQWEYAAAVAGRATPSAYPSGDVAPTCDQTVFGRAVPGVPPGAPPACADRPQGPRPVSESDADASPLGVLGLTGGVAEWTRDSLDLYDGRCWSAVSVNDASCTDALLPERAVRGAGWTTAAPYLFARRRYKAPVSDRETMVGFRCVYAAKSRQRGAP